VRSKVRKIGPRRGPNEELRVAVVGINGQGCTHIRNHNKDDNVRVVTICDVDERLFGERIKIATDMGAPAPKTETDVRNVIDDKDVDIVSIATPNHWHALISVWACRAGKDVYVQKPCSHNISEGRRIVEAARKYKCMVQHGTQQRSSEMKHEAMQMLHEGVIGEVYMARALCYKNRDSIGIKDDCPVPEGVHYDLWLGPAPKQPFNPNRFHYDWHWNWDYGNGDIGNQGVHEMDVAMWGLGKCRTHPVKVHSLGGRYTYIDQGLTPNTQVATFTYQDGKMLVFEVRGRQTNDESGITIGNIFYGSKGYMVTSSRHYGVFLGKKPGPKKTLKSGSLLNFKNFHAAVRSRKISDLNADIEIGHHAATLCHLANASYRLGRSLNFDPKTETFPGDAEANKVLTRKYRKPYEMPEKV